MKLQLMRNATMKITLAGRTLLTDPMLAPRGAIDPFAGIARNPTVELPLPVDQIVEGLDGVIVSHLHPDHFDAAAAEVLDNSLPVFCPPEDKARLAEYGFQSVTAIDDTHRWGEVALTRTGGLHGSGPILERMGPVSGFVIQAQGEPTVYWVGDSIWCDPVRAALEKFDPDVVITHSGGATIPGFDPIVMDGAQTLALAQAAPAATIVAVHMEALDHCPVARAALRRMAEAAGIPSDRLMIPGDGQIVSI